MELVANILNLLLSVILSILGVFLPGEAQPPTHYETLTLEEIPAYEQSPFVVLENNLPTFTQEELSRLGEEVYSPHDAMGRCGPAFAVVGPETMPTEERESIGQVKPSGWQTVKYDCVDGKYLYNRCHLIGFQLTGENANAENLITGTRYLNIEGMLPFENEVADYVEETGNHVAYRVTPVFQGEDLLARGVQMEAWSVEDGGTGLCFNVFAYNVQPGVGLDYATGDSWEEKTDWMNPDDSDGAVYVVNVKTGRFHLPTCGGVTNMDAKNREEITGSREDLLSMGYTACGQCKP